MSERHAVTTEDLANQHTAPEPRFSEEHDERDEPRAEELPEQATGEPAAVEKPIAEQPAVPAPSESLESTEPQRTQLFDADDVERFRDNWRAVQGDFVDDPRRAVQQADGLVAEVMRTLASTFADHKRTLEEQWSRGEDAQTEDLRLALVQYRTFFQQLLAI